MCQFYFILGAFLSTLTKKNYCCDVHSMGGQVQHYDNDNTCKFEL